MSVATARFAGSRGRAMARELTAAEQRVVAACNTPRQVQAWLRSLAYNRQVGGRTLRTFRGVVRHRHAHCLEAALAAAAILERHGRPPLVLDLESQDGLDHVLYLHRRNGRWGAIAKSRDAGLEGRKAVFRRIRDLVYSYVDPYVDGSGRVVGYAVADLNDLTRADWRLSEGNVWSVERALMRLRHRRLRTSNRRYARALARFRAFREAHPDRPMTDFPDRALWL